MTKYFCYQIVQNLVHIQLVFSICIDELPSSLFDDQRPLLEVMVTNLFFQERRTSLFLYISPLILSTYFSSMLEKRFIVASLLQHIKLNNYTALSRETSKNASSDVDIILRMSFFYYFARQYLILVIELMGMCPKAWEVSLTWQFYEQNQFIF